MKIEVFKNQSFGVRGGLIDGEPYFVAMDIAKALDYSDTEAMTRRLEDDEVQTLQVVGFGNRGVNFINESGLYNAIIGSKKQEAKQFKKWVTSEVLPSIRKHGMYATEVTIEKMISNPDFAIQLLTTLKEEKTKRVEAERRNAILMHTNKTYTTTEIAKELGFKSANMLNKMLSDLKVQFKQNGTWVLYSKYSNLGYTDIKQGVSDNGQVYYDRHWTQDGREFILNFIGETK